jgi:hypothetical protein
VQAIFNVTPRPSRIVTENISKTLDSVGRVPLPTILRVRVLLLFSPTERAPQAANVEIIFQEWIETAKEPGRPILAPRGRLTFA